jgi:hypothetical protein
VAKEGSVKHSTHNPIMIAEIQWIRLMACPSFPTFFMEIMLSSNGDDTFLS